MYVIWWCINIDRYRFTTCYCEMHYNGYMNIIWGLCWGGSKSTKPCVFPCKMTAAGDERYLLCAAVAAAVIRECVPPLCFVTSGCSCVRSSMRVLNLWFQIAMDRNGMVAWLLNWGGSRSTKSCVFPCKMAAAGHERYLVCAAVAAAVISSANTSLFCNERLFLCV